ncbi:hypothetical protein BT96DRAFT_982422 [Gymnopus androsaceus JB14]|uniref:Uncharacterized protein n=1 Tax=Gymnopus androsaceus JB14 TaxID=1447944 RepID=A0A6A4GE89_9AGAR|nr:hypothetical protein BT96DRAFT_982422 [Gymnopus androsaceus JB14]
MMNAQQLARKEAKKRQKNKKEDLATPDSVSPPLSFPQSSGSPEPSRNRSPSPEISPPPEMAKPSKCKMQAAMHLMGFKANSTGFLDKPEIHSDDEDSEGEDSEGEDSEDEDDEDENDEDGDLDEDSNSEKVISKVQKTKVLAPLVIRLKPKKKGSTKQVFTFSVPVGDADEAIHLTTPISWSNFEHALANAHGIAPKSIQVAYRFSTLPQTSSFHHVWDASELAELVKDAEVAEDGLAKSRAQIKKKFVSEKEKKAKAKAKGKAKMGKNKHKCAQRSDSDSSDNDDGEQKPKKKKMGQEQWIAQITADNQCLEHKHVCLKSIASHPLLKNADIATWALIMTTGWPSTTNPPPKLKLDFEKVTAAPIPQAPLPTYQTPTMGGYGPYGTYTLPPSSPFRPHCYSRCNELPSSDPIEPMEDVTLFPPLQQWLIDLDNGVQGHDGHNFASFAPDFL